MYNFLFGKLVQFSKHCLYFLLYKRAISFKIPPYQHEYKKMPFLLMMVMIMEEERGGEKSSNQMTRPHLMHLKSSTLMLVGLANSGGLVVCLLAYYLLYFF